jgi:protein O-mannosyl-transferase
MAIAAVKPAVAPKDPTTTSKPQGLFSSPGKRNVILCLLLALTTLAVYNPVTHADFTNYDDDHYVYENSHIRAGLTWQTVAYAFRTFDAGNWHPLTWLSHALDYQLFHLNPAGHHYVSVLLHVCNAILLFLLLCRATSFVWRSLTVAALFALHPLNVESVAWVAERKNVLCTFFFLLAIGAYGWYVRRPGIKRYLVLATMFTLALMSKPMAITLPFVLLLLDYWPLQRMDLSLLDSAPATVDQPADSHTAKISFTRLVVEKLPLFLLSIGSALSTVIAQKAAGAINTGLDYGARARVLNAVLSYGKYLWKAAYPANLAPMYPHPGDSLKLVSILPSAALLVLIMCIVLVMRRHRHLLVGWFGYLGVMVPMIGLVQVGRHAMADRYAYIPVIGIFIAIVWSLAEASQVRRFPAKALAPIAMLVLANFAWVTHTQIGYWHDSISLWSHAVVVTENNYIAHDNLGEALAWKGEREEALAHFRTAAQIEPKDPVSVFNIGVLAHREQKVAEAIAQYQATLRMTGDPEMVARVLTNLGSAYRVQGDFVTARNCYLEALRQDPQNSLPLLGLGLMAQKTGDAASAVDYYMRAMKLEPTDVGFLLMASAYQQGGRVNDAKAAAERSKQLSTDLNRTQETARKLLAE